MITLPGLYGSSGKELQLVLSRLLRMKVFAQALFVGLVATTVAVAEQAPPPTATQPCPEDPKRPPRTDNPSDRLAETKGVICPPTGVDPGIETKPPTNDGTLKVIPPPGAPGANPKEQK
jgi:hypothetical protein